MNSALQLIAFAVLMLVLIVILWRLSQIHVLVNSRLTEALDDIAALKKALVAERRKEKP